MSDKYLTRREICDALNISRSTFYRRFTQNPNFPKPISISSGCKRYSQRAVENYISSLCATPNHIREA